MYKDLPNNYQPLPFNSSRREVTIIKLNISVYISVMRLINNVLFFIINNNYNIVNVIDLRCRLVATTPLAARGLA